MDENELPVIHQPETVALVAKATKSLDERAKAIAEQLVANGAVKSVEDVQVSFDAHGNATAIIKQGKDKRFTGAIRGRDGKVVPSVTVSQHRRLSLLGPAPEPRTKQLRANRNEPCPCGSGKKFKHCHGGKQ